MYRTKYEVLLEMPRCSQAYLVAATIAKDVPKKLRQKAMFQCVGRNTSPSLNNVIFFAFIAGCMNFHINNAAEIFACMHQNRGTRA